MREVSRLARYVSHIEAAYRIIGFPMHYPMHTVIFLSPHSPNEEPIYFKGEHAQRNNLKSKLLAHFDPFSQDDNAKNMAWTEVAEHYCFNGTRYVPFKKEKLRIARMWSVNPKLQELYVLRKLLLFTKGVSSDKRTHNGVVY